MRKLFETVNVTNKMNDTHNMLFKESYDMDKVIYIYRYISLFLTSIFYLFVTPTSIPIFKIGVVISLILASIIINDIYIKHSESTKIIKVTVFIEIIGITLLLIPTGGIKSPFIWYALNSVLVTACVLPTLFCWIELLFYFTSSLAISVVLFRKDYVSLKILLYDNLYLWLILTLITLMVQLLSKLLRESNYKSSVLRSQREKLIQVNIKLKQANDRDKYSMDLIMSLYQMVEAFNFINDPQVLLRTVVNYAVKATFSKFSFFYLFTADNRNLFSTNDGAQDELAKDVFNEISSVHKANIIFIEPTEYYVKDTKVVLISVKSSSTYFGYIGIGVEKNIEQDDYSKYASQLLFLAELSGIILERFRLEKVAAELLISEEQNRIANVMHDNISQRLFSIVCASYALSKKIGNMPAERIKEQIDIISISANTAMQDLRTTIYKLSSKKKNEKKLFLLIRLYLNELSKLNEVYIDLNTIGNEDSIDIDMKNSIYRIVCEATSNAIRHGHCNKLKVYINIENKNVEMKIIDNGSGFNVEEILKQENVGLGIRNIKRLVESYNGKIIILSTIGKGTNILINI